MISHDDVNLNLSLELGFFGGETLGAYYYCGLSVEGECNANALEYNESTRIKNRHLFTLTKCSNIFHLNNHSFAIDPHTHLFKVSSLLNGHVNHVSCTQHVFLLRARKLLRR